MNLYILSLCFYWLTCSLSLSNMEYLLMANNWRVNTCSHYCRLLISYKYQTGELDWKGCMYMWYLYLVSLWQRLSKNKYYSVHFLKMPSLCLFYFVVFNISWRNYTINIFLMFQILQNLVTCSQNQTTIKMSSFLIIEK